MKSTALYKPTVIAALLAAVVLQLSGSPQATLAQNPPNVATEARALGQFGKGLADFLTLTDTLRAKPARSTADISSLESNAARLKGSVSGFRSNLDAFIRKQKNAGQWNAQLDSAVEGKLDVALKDFARRNGGARKLLELALSDLGGFSAEIDATTNEVKRLRIGALGRDAALKPVAYTPAPVFAVRLKCVLLFAAAGASALAGFDLGEEEATAAFKKNKCGSNAAPTT